MRRGRPCVTFLAASAIVGCSTGPEEFQCPAKMMPALEVSVVDAQTSEPVDNPLVVTTTGSRVDTLLTVGSRATGPLEVSGIFRITVEKVGYITWEVDGVEVEAGDCGPEMVSLTARLRPGLS